MTIRRTFLNLIVLFSLSSQLHAEETLRVGISEGVTGVVEFSDGELTGALSKPYDCVFDNASIPVEFVSVPLKRGLYYLESGELDALIPLARSPERDESLIFAGELIRADYSYVAFKPIDDLLAQDILRVAVVRGFVGSLFLPKTVDQVEEVNSWEQLVPMLDRDRVDVSVIPTLLLEQVMGDRIEDAYIKPAGVLEASLYISAQHRASEVAERIQKAVEQCQAEPGAITRG